MLLRALAGAVIGQVGAVRRKRSEGPTPSRWERWVSEPRSAVLFVLFSVLIVGGGRKLLQARRAREAVEKLDDPAVTAEAIAAAGQHGRAGLIELFRLLGTAGSQALRDVAGHTISILWARDDLIAEEEKALVRRGFQVQWKARRRYPRALRAPIPIAVEFGVPFLQSGGPGVDPGSLEWSYRILGARRASLEVHSPWVAGPGLARFELIPSDFETDGPHRLVLQARVRTRGLTDPWELELPHVMFNFEFDPHLDVNALFALPDDTRAQAFSHSIRLAAPRRSAETDGSVPAFSAINETLAIRHLPTIDVTTPLPCDLAHAVELEFQGVAEPTQAGALTLSGQGDTGVHPQTQRFSIGPVAPIPAGAIERPGTRAVRVRLVPDPDRGWADPDIRSIWPEPIVTEWVDVEIVRR